MKLILISSFSVFLFLILYSCDTNEPLPQGAVGLTLEDVSCTEAWITLTAGNLSNTAYIRITGNGKLIETLDVNATQTTLYYDTLKPNTTYEFQAFSSQRGEDVIGNKLQVTTLDTTSHDFTWQTFEFGQHSSSTLYDVAIINENDIWAVGEIYMNDSLGNPDPTSYNAVHWNGQSWELKKIGEVGDWACHTVFAFSTDDIWFEGTIHWNGSSYTVHKNGWPLMPNGDGWQVNKMWGSSSNDLYAIGNNGNIARYNGSRWAKIESGTTTKINDIWGVDLGNEGQLVLCSVSNLFDPGDYKVLKIENNKVDSISWRSGRRVSSTWFTSKNKIFASGGGVFVSTSPDYLWREQIEIPLIYTDRVRGISLNDVFVVGDFGLVAHYNGLSWRIIPEANVALNHSLDFKNNLMISVGQRNQKAVILKMY
jgi:hypothetical protein